MPVPCRTRFRLMPRLLVAVALGLLVPSTAPAFFFFGWPGSGEAAPRSLIPPNSTDFMNPPSARPEPPPPPPDTPENPQEHPEVPEPASGIAALIGLAVVGLRWKRQR